MKNKIDLSKIKVNQLPTQTITANFEGTPKKYTIRALNDGEKTNIYALLAGAKDVYRVRNLYVCLLSCGLDIEPAVAAFLYDNKNEEAVRVGEAVSELSGLFDAAKAEEVVTAEKNSSAETATEQP